MFDYLPTYAKLYIYFLAFTLGAFFGSALNCLAYRMARGQKWSKGRSVCPHCGHTLGVADLIPVFSWLFLKGKCRHCGKQISPRYMIAEVVLGVCFVGILRRFGLTFQTVSALTLCCCLFCLSLIDLDIQIIPDRFLVIPAVVQLLLLFTEGRLLIGLLPAIVCGGGLLVLSLIMDRLLQKETMGGGDIKLAAMLGLYFGFGECLFLIAAACLIGIFTAAVLLKCKADTPFPFGPALSIAAYVTLLFGDQIVSWYLSFF